LSGPGRNLDAKRIKRIVPKGAIKALGILMRLLGLF
jgi:hypothetical protein